MARTSARMGLVATLVATVGFSSAASAREKLETSTPTYTWIGFGAAGLGLVVGTLFGVDALQAAGTAREQCVGTRCAPGAQSFIDQSKSSATISTLSFGFAIVGVGVGLHGLLSSSPTVQEEEKPTPLPGPELSLRVGPGSIAIQAAF